MKKWNHWDVVAIVGLSLLVIGVYFIPNEWRGKWYWFSLVVFLEIVFVAVEIWSIAKTGKSLTQNLYILKRDQFWIWTIYFGTFATFFLYLIACHLGANDDPKWSAWIIASVFGGALNALAGRGVKEGEQGPKHIRIWLRLIAKGLICGTAVWIISGVWWKGIGVFALNFTHALPMTPFNNDILDRPFQFLRGLLIGTKMIVASLMQWGLGLIVCVAYAMIYGVIQLKNIQKEGVAETAYGFADDGLTCLVAF